MKRVRIAIVVVFVALLGVIAWQVAQPSVPEPVYKGGTLTSWLKRGLTGAAESSEVREAVRQAGTNAIPTLLRLLRAKDSAFKLKLMALVQRQHVIKISFVPAWEWNSRAATALADLGTNAQSAVPALIDIVNQNISPESRSCAMTALAGLGPAAKAAIPALMVWMSAMNADAELGGLAWEVLCCIDRVAAERGESMTAESESIRKESLEQSFNNVLTNEQQFLHHVHLEGTEGPECLDGLFVAPRAVRIIQTIESMSPSEREPACRRLFAQAFAIHSNTIAALIRMREDPSAPKNRQSMYSSRESVCIAMFLAADLGLRSLLAEEFRDLEGLPDTGFSIPDNGSQLNFLRLLASHDPSLNSMVTKVVEEELRSKGLRSRSVSIFDAEITWYTQLRMGSRALEAPQGLKTYEFVDWYYIKLDFKAQKALVQRLKRLVFSREAQ